MKLIIGDLSKVTVIPTKKTAAKIIPIIPVILLKNLKILINLSFIKLIY